MHISDINIHFVILIGNFFSFLFLYLSLSFLIFLCSQFVDSGAHYDIFLKFENRYHWGYQLLSYLKLHDNQIFEGFIQDSQIPFKGADTMEVFLKHYTLRTLEQVKTLYRKDINMFGYQKDVEIIEQMIIEAANSSK